MKTSSLLRLWVAASVAFAACADPEPPRTDAPSAPAAEQPAPLVYWPSTDPVCTDDDPSGNPYAGPPTNAGPRPTWTSVDIQHPADMLDHDNDPGTPDINLRQLPDYRNISHNLSFLQSLRFLISTVTRITKGLENAQSYVEEHQYIDDAMTWVNGQIPQTVGHCLCVGSCAPGGCNPETIIGNVEATVDTIMNDLHFDTLLQEFLSEKIDATIADLEGLKDYFESRFTTNYLLDFLGQVIQASLTAQMEDAVAHFTATVAACQPLIDQNDPNFGPLHVDIDAAVAAAMAQIEAEFASDIAAIQSVIDAYTAVGAALPELKEKTQALLAQFQGVSSLKDLISVNWQEVADAAQELADSAQTVWPAIENVINQDWTGFWDDLVNFQDRMETLAQNAYDDVINALLSSPNASACINAILASGSYLDPGQYDVQQFVDNLKQALKDAITDEWEAAKAEIQQVLQNLQDRINGIGEDALAFVEQKLEDIKDQIIAAATDGCYMRGYRAECYDFCGTTDPSSAQECFLWLPVDFLQQPAATAASAGLFVLNQTGFLDTLVEWMDDNLTDYLSSKLGELADLFGTLNETLQKIHDLFFTAFAYIDRFSEGYHLGAYSELRPDLHMCIGYAGHGAYAQMGNLGGDHFSIGARYSAHNLSKKNRVQFRSGGFAVSAFGHELSLLPGIEINTQIHGFELWDIRRPLGIPLNVTISPETLAKLDIFNNLPPDNSPTAATSPYGLIIDQGNGLPLGAAIVRDLWPVRDAANQVVWPRPEVSDVIDPANTPGAPEWESDSTAVVSLGVNLPIDIDPPKKYLPSIPIITGILTVTPYWDIAFGVEWDHEVDLYLLRILEKVNQNLPASDHLDQSDLRRPMHAMQGDDLTADNGTAAYVEPEIGFDVFLGFKIWKIRIGASASLGLAVNIRPGGHGGVVDMNSALADALLHSNPPADAPCTPIWQTTVHEGCNNGLVGGDPEASYSCEPSEAESSCCIHLAVTYAEGTPPGDQSEGYWGCVDDWTGLDQQLCKDINSTGKTVEEVIKNLPQVPAPVGPWLIDRLADLGSFVGQTPGATGIKITSTWNQGVHCQDSECGKGQGTLLSTSILDIHSISECAQHGYCTWADGTVVHDLTEAECKGSKPGAPGASAPDYLYSAVDIGDMVCALETSSDPTEDGRVRCWKPGPVAAGPFLGDVPGVVPGKSSIECDSAACAWGKPNALVPATELSPYLFSHNGPQGCGLSGSDTDCSHLDDATHDLAVGPEGTTSLVDTGALRYDDEGLCPSPFDPVAPSAARHCVTNYLVQRLACGTATPPADTHDPVNIPSGVCNATFNPGHFFYAAEYDDQTLCAIETSKPGNLPPVGTPAEVLPGGSIRCAYARSAPAPFGPAPGNPASCAAVKCDFGYVCEESDTMPPTCVLSYSANNHPLASPFAGLPGASDFIDVASAGNQVVCGLHSGFGTQPMQLQCGFLGDWWQTCDVKALLNPPLGQFRDVEAAGPCTLCALSLDGSQITCWGDGPGASPVSLAAPQDDPFVDLGGLSAASATFPSIYKVCGVTQSGLISCNDPAYEPYPRLADGETADPPLFTAYQCHTIQETEVTGWQGDGCHPLQHGFASACGCATDDDCMAGETCTEGRCEGTGGGSCECDASGACPNGRVCSDGACARPCTSDADCGPVSECRTDGSCGPKHGVPYAETITWGMSNVEAPMHTINTYAMSDILATLILKFAATVEASFKLFGKEKTWKLFEYVDSWDLGSTWKGWYQPGLEARYQDECADPDLQTTVTNRFPRSLTSNPYDNVFDTSNVPILRNCPNGGVCRYRDPLPASHEQPWQYTDGNVGTVEELITWCKDDMPQHQENPDAASPEDLMDGVVATYEFGESVGWTLYAQSQPCIDGQPVNQWLADLMPETDANGNVTDPGILGTKDCFYDDPQTGIHHVFPCSEINMHMMRIWGCLDRTASPYAQYLWDQFPELQNTTDPGGAPHDWIDIDVMFWPTPGSDLAYDYSPSTMKPSYRHYVAHPSVFQWVPKVGEKWLGVVEGCFDARYYSAAETKCECATDADCNEDRGEKCSPNGCLEPHAVGGATQWDIKECPIVGIDMGVESCCGDGVVVSEPVQIIAPADPEKDPELYEAHGCSDPDSEDPVCAGLWYVEECDGGPGGSATCSATCQLTGPAPEPGACCAMGGCFENLGPAECQAKGGVFHAGTDCAAIGYCGEGCVAGPCDDGNACTDQDRCDGGECVGQMTVDCNDGNPCTVDSCDPDTGCVYTQIPGCGEVAACCLPSGQCIDVDAQKCKNGGGSFTPGALCSAGWSCAPVIACCLPTGECKEGPKDQCIAAGGTPTDGSCETPGLCTIVPQGACCLPDGACKTLTEATCLGADGAWLGVPQCFTANMCSIPTACCLPDGCAELGATACLAAGGKVDFGHTCTETVLCAGGGLCGGEPDPDLETSILNRPETAATGPSLAIVAPKSGAALVAGADGATDVTVLFEVSGAAVGTKAGVFVNWSVDGKPAGTSDALTPFTVPGVGPGAHTVVGQLSGAAGALTNPRSKAVAHISVMKPCKTADECSDGNACSFDACIKGFCRHKVDPGCCQTNLDCPLGAYCVDNACVACLDAGDCDDGNACTKDCCGDGGVCYHDAAQGPGCCASDADCADADLCTFDRCVEGQCVHTQSANPLCCTTADDCPAVACQKATCSGSKLRRECRYAPIEGCCTADADCADADRCTVDQCDAAAGICLPPVEIPGCCATDADCNDGNPCSKDTCRFGKCSHLLLKGCAVPL